MSELTVKHMPNKMKTTRYILEGKMPKPCNDLIEWAGWMDMASCKVGDTMLPKNIRISTVFLGLDYSFTGDTPILFETMIFGGKHAQYQERYATWKEAELGHKKAVKLAKESILPLRKRVANSIWRFIEGLIY